jgi:Protein of unknown function (DUF3551)
MRDRGVGPADATGGKQSREVIVSIVNKLTTAAAAIAAVICLGGPASHAQYYGGAPWCAVLQVGTGAVTWHCYYRTVEDCVPNVIAGNRGSCNVNPYWTGAQPGAAKHSRRYKPS